ncbi:Type I phosphodiesterase nucleotide pyrophosphatase [Mycena indigotica]|uniref:Type I phosphodiesterase nucleotide pyrophosphatase n=1 Tax=Mycena indigotica TaxID=2126181 RepID=A0A8H6SHE7_9AGAR|nr:Type I phosphodiesterase nucleotide pyrophosphatase [Mycena indigotica]KAF7298845.1 Type I phosphodiesterase nucleotide pyrophosphatase [Mycena indigotica]
MSSSGSARSASYKPLRKSDKEERKGLLSNTEDAFNPAEEDWKTEPELDDLDTDRGWSRKKIIFSAVALMFLLITGVTARTFLLTNRNNHRPEDTHPNLLFHGDGLRSNGTHDFKRTVLIVSIDGLRADYLDRGLTPHLLDISKQGLRAKSLIPIFPTLTFPNHWALMTGLYAESHGIVGNNFWDPISNSEFHYNQISSVWNPTWWLGEPMWETAGKAKIITANLMWPGPPKTTSSASSTYFVPWKDKVPLAEKLDQLLAWIDLPLETRPQLLMAYEPSLDQAGHKAGPMSALVNKTLAQVDIFAKDLHNALVARNLTEIVDIVFVSDHGMTDTSHPELIYMDDILGSSGYASIEHEDGWPAMGLRFSASANVSHNLELLRAESAKNGGRKFEVFTKAEMPKRWHFANNERIAPIYVVPKIGYVLTSKKEGDVGMSKGNHGYDNTAHSMQAMFVAHGPFSSVVKVLHQGRSSHLKRIFGLSRPNKGWHSTSADTYVMEPFENVQIYSLVMRLLGVDKVAPTNGSTAFWDKYF